MSLEEVRVVGDLDVDLDNDWRGDLSQNGDSTLTSLIGSRFNISERNGGLVSLFEEFITLFWVRNSILSNRLEESTLEPLPGSSPNRRFKSPPSCLVQPPLISAATGRVDTCLFIRNSS